MLAPHSACESGQGCQKVRLVLLTPVAFVIEKPAMPHHRHCPSRNIHIKLLVFASCENFISFRVAIMTEARKRARSHLFILLKDTPARGLSPWLIEQVF